MIYSKEVKNMHRIMHYLKRKDDAAIGIGTMIIFIAMVLVAGIAASVLIQTSARLESQAMATGEETTSEVATGLEVTEVQGHVDNGSIDRLAITIRCRAGSRDIDLNTAVLELSDGDDKYVLKFNTTPVFASAPAIGGIFATDVFDDLSNAEFGIIILQDADNSATGTNPVMNRGDKIVLSVNATATFGGLSERTQVSGRIVPEEGAAGIISFRTPASFTSTIMKLQ
jgi:archaeal flagellin FlaB